MGNDQRNGGSSSSSSSKKNKSTSPSTSSPEKPKQPQRGLGVAQLEKIRLHTQLANCGFIPHPAFSPYPLNPFQHVHQEQLRMQAAGYQQAVMQGTIPYGYVPAAAPNAPNPYGYNNHPNNYSFHMGIGEHMERTGNIRFGESHPNMTTRWDHNNNAMAATPENHHQFMQQPQGLVTRHLLSNVEQNNARGNMVDSNGSSSHGSGASPENEEIDLELKL